MRTNCAGDIYDRGWRENSGSCVELMAEDWIDYLRYKEGAYESCAEWRGIDDCVCDLPNAL